MALPDTDRAAFTDAIVAALQDLDHRKAPSLDELGKTAYQKLQYDLPLVSENELHGLTETLRASLQLKSQQPPFPLTAKLLENILAGARAPLPATSTLTTVKPANTTTADGSGATGGGANGEKARAPTATNDASKSLEDGAVAATAEPSAAPLGSLLQPGLLSADRLGLCAAYRALCSVVFVQLVAHCLSVSEQETWALLHGVAADAGGEDDAAEGEDAAEAAAPVGSRNDMGQAGDGEGDAAGPSGVEEEGEQRLANGGASVSNGLHESGSGCPEAGHVPATQPRPPDPQEEPMAAEEDGDDFVFEDIEEPGPSAAAASCSAAGRPTHSTPPSTPPPPPYAWPALRHALLHLASHVSYAGLLDDPSLWADGGLLAGVLQLLRALGAHRHAAELAPLLGAYVGLLADRVAAEPGELGCLEGLWDAVGLSCFASLPAQVGRPRPSAAGRPGGQGPLLAEASTCLSLVASLAAQLTSASARQRLWQQVHRHMLPLLERCLGELARAVGSGQAAGRAAGKAAAAAARPAQELKGPGPEEVAAIVLVCQVLDFYVQQRPGNADLGAALKGSGVLASLAVLFAAAGGLPGAEPLRSAALGCAASSRELASWVLAVPGVSKALTTPAFQEGGPCEAHGAVWELLASGGSSPLALSILAGGAAPDRAGRVHALLQLLSKAAACRGGSAAGGAGLWGPAVDRALRDLLAALREEQNSASGSGWRAATGVASGVSGTGSSGAETLVEGSGGAAMTEPDGEEEEDDEDKLRLLDPAALQRRRARQLHPACWRILKQLLAAGVQMGGKTD